MCIIISSIPVNLLTISLIFISLTLVLEVISPVIKIFECPPQVSIAHLESLSPLTYSYKIESDILSQSLSGCQNENWKK